MIASPVLSAGEITRSQSCAPAYSKVEIPAPEQITVATLKR
jgi:hypothetical protein